MKRSNQLTLSEKASLCLGADLWHTAAVPRLGVRSIMMADGPHGLRHKPDADRPSTPATCFPAACALGSSWNPDLVHLVGQALGAEAHAQGVAVVLGPGINIKRSPLCGRNFEYFSEDPLISGVLGAAHVEGVQSRGVGACVKHFAANNQETDRLRVSADVDERTLREIYLPGFERVVTRARPWMVMCAYNKVNGVYASEHHWLLTEVLREQWGFDGVVVSDWGAVHDRVAALAAGLDLEMPPNLGVSDAAIVDAVNDGKLAEALLDRSVERILHLVDRAHPGSVERSLHLVDRAHPADPTTSTGTAAAPPITAASATTSRHPEPIDAATWSDAHHALARAVATECAVLLKNDGDILPLRPVAGELVAVIGEFARTPRYQGAGSSQVNPTRLDIPLDELRAAVPANVEVAYAPGFTVDSTELADEAVAPAARSGAGIADEAVALAARSGTGLAGEAVALAARAGADFADEAVALAARAGTVLVFLGLPPAEESEGFDRTHLELPADQTALLPRLAAVNPNVVVVLANGSAVRMAHWEQHARAILECWLLGQAAGGAITDLLLGKANPSGRLAETLPRQLRDTPSYLNFPGEEGHVRYGEGIFVGYRGHDALGQDVSYPFGHGLSYTTFSYTDLTFAITGSGAGGDLAITVACTVTNTGQRAGKEVVQLYVGDPEAAVARPPRELKGFAKIDLDPGAARTVTFELGARDLSYWSTAHHRWILEGGQFEIAVGASSRDLRLTRTIEVPATPPPVRLDAMATLQEWLADPEGAAALREAVGVNGILADDEMRAVIGNFPLSSLATFPGTGIDHGVIDALTRRF